jgi:hypothetical protein
MERFVREMHIHLTQCDSEEAAGISAWQPRVQRLISDSATLSRLVTFHFEIESAAWRWLPLGRFMDASLSLLPKCLETLEIVSWSPCNCSLQSSDLRNTLITLTGIKELRVVVYDSPIELPVDALPKLRILQTTEFMVFSLSNLNSLHNLVDLVVSRQRCCHVEIEGACRLWAGTESINFGSFIAAPCAFEALEYLDLTTYKIRPQDVGDLLRRAPRLSYIEVVTNIGCFEEHFWGASTLPQLFCSTTGSEGLATQSGTLSTSLEELVIQENESVLYYTTVFDERCRRAVLEFGDMFPSLKRLHWDVRDFKRCGNCGTWRFKDPFDDEVTVFGPGAHDRRNRRLCCFALHEAVVEARQ